MTSGPSSLSSRPVTIVLLVLSLSVLAWLLWPHATSKARKASPPAASKTGGDLVTRRARRDLQGLGAALGALSARTLGMTQVTGRVVSADDTSGDATGIADAEVIFTGPMGESTTTTDSEGHFAIEVPPGLYRSYARHSDYVSVARHKRKRLPGPVSAGAVAMPREGIAPLLAVFRDQRIELSMAASVRVFGQVRDREGRPISEAIVAGNVGEWRVISGSDVSESDASGNYELVVLRGFAVLEANHDDFAGTERPIQVDAYNGPVEQDIQLRPGCIVEGWVTDEDGTPILEGSFERDMGDDNWVPIGAIEGGRVRFTTTTQQGVRLRAWPWKHPPSKPKLYLCSNDVHMDNHFRDVQFIIPNADPSLTGYVEDEVGQRVPFVFVDLFAVGNGVALQQERTDANGEFAFHEVKDGSYQLSVFAAGRGATATVVNSPSADVPLRLAGVGSIVGSTASMNEGYIELQYRCDFKLGQETALRDDFSMPWQKIRAPVSRGRFRIDDLPACPLEGYATGTAIAFEKFHVDIKPRRETPVRLK